MSVCQVVTEVRKTQNMFYTKCPDCEDDTSPNGTARRRYIRDDWMEDRRVPDNEYEGRRGRRP
jgi:hypothetical protein